MKKFLCFLIITALAFSLPGCGYDGSTAASAEEKDISPATEVMAEITPSPAETMTITPVSDEEAVLNSVPETSQEQETATPKVTAEILAQADENDIYEPQYRTGLYENILGMPGFYREAHVGEAETPYTWYWRNYYALFPGSDRVITIARSFYFDHCEDYSADLDGDGVNELICNCQYGGDGAKRVRVFRLNEGIIEVGQVDWESIYPGNDFLFRSLCETYRPDHQDFQLSYAHDWGEALTTDYKTGLNLFCFFPYRSINGESTANASYQSLLIQLRALLFPEEGKQLQHTSTIYDTSIFNSFLPYDVENVRFTLADANGSGTNTLFILINDEKVYAVRYSNEKDQMTTVTMGEPLEAVEAAHPEFGLSSCGWFELTEENLLTAFPPAIQE